MKRGVAMTMRRRWRSRRAVRAPDQGAFLRSAIGRLEPRRAHDRLCGRRARRLRAVGDDVAAISRGPGRHERRHADVGRVACIRRPAVDVGRQAGTRARAAPGLAGNSCRRAPVACVRDVPGFIDVSAVEVCPFPQPSNTFWLNVRYLVPSSLYVPKFEPALWAGALR